MICRQLGYVSGTYDWNKGGGPRHIPIHLDDIDCAGDESRLVDCNHATWGEHSCNHEADLAVICSKLKEDRNTVVQYRSSNL